MSNPESFVIDKINRLETDWASQDEWIEQSFEHGRITGEYYGQTGTEHLARVEDAERYARRSTTWSASDTVICGDMVYLSSVVANLHIYGLVTTNEARSMTATFTIAADDGVVTLPPLVLPEGQPGAPEGWTPFDADGNLCIDWFVDVGCMADDGLTMRADWLPGDNDSEGLFQQQESTWGANRMAHLDLDGSVEVVTPSETARQVDL